MSCGTDSNKNILNMKKVFMLLAVCATVAFATAQTTVRGSKLTDNVSVGIQAGGVTPASHHAFFGDARPTVGLTLAKEFTPVIGLAAEFNSVINAQHNLLLGPKNDPANTKKWFDASNLSGLLRINLVNLFKDYTGEPGLIDVKAVYGFGWGHEYYGGGENNDRDFLTSKAGLDFGINLGADKAWQINVKPAYVWAYTDGETAIGYNNHFGHIELLAGVTYKLKNSNGTHNFTLVKEYDQAEVDGLNAKVNDLRNQLSAKDRKIAADAAALKKLQDELNACRNKSNESANAGAGKGVNSLETNVFFAQGKSTISAAQLPNVERVANYLKNHPNAKVAINGYASPEGGKAINDKLSKNRAEAVKNRLIKKYKIDPSRIVEVKGNGVGNLFSEPTWNRVAISTITE